MSNETHHTALPLIIIELNTPPSSSLSATSPSISLAHIIASQSTAKFPNIFNSDISLIISPETGGENVPSPFKNYLFRPKTPEKNPLRKNCRQKMLSVVTS